MTVGGAAALDEELAAPAFFQNPYPVYSRLRREDPVHWCEPWRQWLVTRYEDVRQVLQSPDVFSSSGWERSYVARLPEEVRARLPDLMRHYATPVLSNTDPPGHARLRRSVVKSFTPRVLDAIRRDIEALVERLLDDLDERERTDLVADFAYPLPATVIAQLLGAPEARRDQFERWSADIVAFVGSGTPLPERARRADASVRAFRRLLEPLIEERRARPRDDLLSLLVASDSGDGLSQDELVSTCITLLFAGHETTANLIANGLLALLENERELERLRRQPSLAESAVEELLRYDSPVQRVRRVATADAELAGKAIRCGDLVMAFTGAANRDPERFRSPDPDRLDIGRADNGHLAFGHGIHFCVGAALSRIEAPIALRALLRRFPRLRLAEGAAIRWKRNIAFRGLESLVLELR